MKYQRLVKPIVLIVVLIIAVIIVLAGAFASDRILINPNSVFSYNDHWTINNKGSIIECDDISQADIGLVNDKEVVSLTKTLDEFELSNPCLSLYSIHALVYVYLDDELIYSFGQYYYGSQNSIPKKIHFITLGKDYAGKTLRIDLVGGRTASFSGLSDIYIGDRSDMMTFRLHNSRFAILIGLFLFTLGIILVVLSPYLFFYHYKDLRIFFSGLISLMLSAYVMGYYGIFDMLIDNSLLNTVLEYTGLYNIPTVIVGYLMSVYSGKEKKLFSVMFGIDVLLFLSSLILHFTHVARISDFRIVLHIAAFTEFVVAAIFMIYEYRHHKKERAHLAYSADNIFIIGLIIFMLLSIIDILRYNIRKFGHGSGEASVSLVGFTLGALIFVVSLLVSYMFYNIFSRNIASMQSQIMDLAYTDALTGLSNRARCEQMMKTISDEHGNYAIISLDLNKLKYVNDTLGHHEGDRLLTGFATILTDCFWDANLIGRMGGDEFIVILMEDRTVNLTKRIHELYTLINYWNHKEQVFKYSASYGYAYSNEVPHGSAKEVYMLADNRMYEMKREHHLQEEKEVMTNA